VSSRSFPPLELVVFVVGVSTLGAEIAAARLMAPYFGASTVVWANTIAIVLVALSIGYWVGGKLADRHPHLRGLCTTVLIAAVLLGLVPFVADPFLGISVEAFDEYSIGAFAGSLFGVLVLVAIPVLMLGAVAPWAIRLKLEKVEDSGEVAGRMYAISTVGSLLGTFLSSLLLIPLVGTQRTFLAFAAVLALVAAAGLRPRWGLGPVALLALLLAPVGTIKAADGDGRVIHEADTEYQYARVIEYPDGERRLELNEGQAVHSVWRADTFLTGDYWDGFLVEPFASGARELRRVAILGNGAGTTARAYGEFFPDTAVDAVEIDRELFDIGREYFGLEPRPGLRMVAEDARPFLRRSDERYDAIFIDCYRQPYIPFYLTTREFFELVRDRLAPGGVVIVNIGHPEGSQRLEQVLTATAGEALPYRLRDPIEPTNSLLIASASPLSVAAVRGAPVPAALRPLAADVAARLRPALGGGEVYTDDKAPVEWLIDESLIQEASGGKD
jgi:spermidine synthase